MSAELDALKAAIAADADADAKVLAYLVVLKAGLDDVTAKLNAALAAPVIDPAEVQAAADQLAAHAADMTSHVPADAPPAAS